ncbi:response regulator transcription factor [Sporichthya sp.]|uniref:response regulator transcription factor n=1 Tax=Sporichthya sp. TaxID=65475 RepID=UPI0025EA5435|nr:helix-turn-helix transcriptional regulator [Sporichthya sp.]
MVRAARAEYRERLAVAGKRAAALSAGTPGPDLSVPNALAGELDELAQQIHAALSDVLGRRPAEVLELAAALLDLTQLQNRLREHVMAIRFTTLERIHEGLARLRALPTTAQLVPQAAEELARSCDLDRTLVSGVRGSSWRAEAVWIRPDHDPVLARRISEYVTGNWIPLGNGVLETDLVRRRVAILVRAPEGRHRENLMSISESPAFVAAPILANQRVIGFVHADCVEGGRALTTLDRDNVASFAEGFGLVFERTALLERLERQRVRVHDAFGATERELSGLNDAETVLIRRDREAVAVVRMAAGLRKIAISPVDQLLTVRERQVVELMVQGARNRQIADQLVIAEETVKSHVRSISRKLRASSRADAVSRYLQLRIREQA